MARAGRKKGYKTPDEIREKIQGSQLINALQKHIKSDNLSASQVNAAKILLAKIIPDLKATDHTSGGDKVEFPHEIYLNCAGNDKSDS